jgi:sulfate permease, SulP family
MICMTAWDFVIGVLFGIVVSCEHCPRIPKEVWKANRSCDSQGFFFVIQNSQLRSIRAIHTGDTTMSAVRRPSLQRAYIREVSKQTTILRLHGVLGILIACFVTCSLFSQLKGFYFLERSLMSKNLFEVLSKDRLGKLIPCSSSCLI